MCITIEQSHKYERRTKQRETKATRKVHISCHIKYTQTREENQEGPVTFIHQWLYSPLFDPGYFFSLVILFTQTVGHLGRVISPSQGRYLRTG
jgi:hypothetical protein